MSLENYLTTNLAKLNDWLQLDNNEKFQQLNYLLPIIQSLSLIKALYEIAELKDKQANINTITEQLTKFSTQFTDLEMINEKSLNTETSDFSAEEFENLTNLGVLSEEKIADLRNIIAQKNLKYENAHMKIAFNYGDFYQTSFDKQCDTNKKVQKDKIIKAIKDNDAATLIKLAQELQLEHYTQYLQLDELENHAFLNQISNFSRNLTLLLNSSKIYNLNPPKTRATDSTDMEPASLSANLEKLANGKNTESTMIDPNIDIDITIGLETEFLLAHNPTNQQQKEGKDLLREKNITLKKNLADINARRKMQEKYGKPVTLPELTNLNKLLYPLEQNAAKEIIKNSDALKEIRSFVKQKGISINNELTSGIANMSVEEIYFFHLLFCTKEDYKFIFEGINDGENLKANLDNACAAISKNMWHEKTLDMIRASELSIGPFKIPAYQEIIKHIKQMEKIATKCEVKIIKPNLQINFSAKYKNGPNLLLPIISQNQDDEDVKVEISAAGANFIKLLQESLINCAKQNEYLLRGDNVSAALDCKKNLPSIEKTAYLKINEKDNAFLNHKRLAGKNATLRLSKFDDETAVIEVRLIGNNPHFAEYNEAILNNEPSGLATIPAILLPEFYQNLAREIAQLQESNTQKVAIYKDGSIAEITTKPVDVNIESANQGNNPQKVEIYKDGSIAEITTKPVDVN
ncbi:MAG: hypothetical protein ACO2XZ_02490, partial [Rickettsiales bacterium]